MSAPPGDGRPTAPPAERRDGAGHGEGAHDPAARLEAAVGAGRQIEEGLVRYQAFFDASPDPGFITDRRGHVLHANRAALELLGGCGRTIRPWRKPLAAYVALADRRAFRSALDDARGGPGHLRMALGAPGAMPRGAEVNVVPLPGIGGEILWSARLDDDVAL